jgi:RNA polymerase sigma-70 factor (ECF subfamily)
MSDSSDTRAAGDGPAVAPPALDVGPDELALVARLREGDEDAFATMVREFGPRLLAVARRFVLTDEDARDVLQEAFVSAWRGMAKFAGTSRLSTWLHRIVVNAALMRLRSKRRRPEEALEPLLPAFDSDGHHAARVMAWPDAEVRLAREDTRRYVRARINELPETYRIVLLMRDIEGLDTAESARALGITENAVKIRLHRARAALRTLLDPRFREALA